MINQFKGQYQWLSNMAPCQPFVIDGITYNAVENYYQGQKTESIGRRLEMSRMNPYDSKKWGGAITLRKDWNDIKDDVMKRALKIKFSQPKFYNALINTGTKELIEGNYHGDTYWGFCLKTNKGKNKLGQFITEIRAEIFEELESKEYRIDKFPTIVDMFGTVSFKHMDIIATKYLQNEFIKQFEDSTLELVSKLYLETESDFDEILEAFEHSTNPNHYTLIQPIVIDFAKRFDEYLKNSNYEITVK